MRPPAAQRRHAGRRKYEREHPRGTDAGVVELEAIGRLRARSERVAATGTSTAFEPSRLITMSPAEAVGVPSVAAMAAAATAARTNLGILITGSFDEESGHGPEATAGSGA